MTDIGFIGIGNMGGPMIARLAASGFRVHVHDVDPAKVAAAVGEGVRQADSAADAAAAATFVLMSLPTPDIVRAVVTGADGVLAGAAAGSVLIDLSTVDPGTSREVAEACAKQGVGYLEAPVSGGVQAAATGTLTIMVGGEPELLERAGAVLGALGTDVVRVGDIGAAQVAKLCNNMLAAVHVAVLGEVLVTGVRSGLDLDSLFRVLSTSSGSSTVLTRYLPITILTEDRPTRFAMSLMQKDIDLYLRSARQAGTPTPISGAIQGLYDLARCARSGEQDVTGIIEYFESLAGVRLTTAASTNGTEPVGGGAA